MKIRNFSNVLFNNQLYGGRAGQKLGFNWNDSKWFLKFPKSTKSMNNVNISYTTAPLSEYIGSHIYASLGIDVHQTRLGIYNDKLVVACKDFLENDEIILDYNMLKNDYDENIEEKIENLSTSSFVSDNDIEEIFVIMENNLYFKKVTELKKRFWDMFIADTLVGNFDRHNGNWGFLINERLKEVEIAPIYDCASCLYPQLTDERMKKIIDDEEEMNARVFVFPNSALKIDDKKINYYDFISSLDNVDCNKALLRVFPRINLNVINEIIDNTLYISDIRKEFYKKIIKMRYDLLLKVNYNKLISKEG